MTKINIIHTPCKDCIFAIYDDKTQVGCLANRLDVFKQNGVEIIEAYDDALEFYVINGKKCLSYRTNDWLEKRKLRRKTDDHGTPSVKEAVDIVNKENEIKYISVILLETNTTIQNIENIVSSQIKQKIPPKGFMIIREIYNEYDLTIKEISDYFSTINLPWRMQNFIDKDMSFNDRLRSIIKSAPMDRYYYIIYPSKYIDTNFAEKINNYVGQEKPFGCINIHGNLFFSYLSFQYAKNMVNIDILQDEAGQIAYEKIN